MIFLSEKKGRGNIVHSRYYDSIRFSDCKEGRAGRAKDGGWKEQRVKLEKRLNRIGELKRTKTEICNKFNLKYPPYLLQLRIRKRVLHLLHFAFLCRL